MTEATGARRSSPMLLVGIGLGVFGLSNFVFLGVAGRDLGPAGSAPLSVAWTLLNAVGIGLFLPLEQETGRRLSAAAGAGVGQGRAALQRMNRYAVRAVVTLLVVGTVGAVPLGHLLFGDDSSTAVLLAVALAGQALAYYARGVLAGTGSFRRYGAQLALDGVLRIVGAVVVAALDVGSVLTYGALLVVAPVAATLAVIGPGRLLAVARGTSRATAAVAGRMAPLVLAALAGQLLANAGPVVIALLTRSGEQDVSGNFVAAVTIARIPLFLFAAVQAVFLPSLAALVAEGRASDVADAVRRALLATGALAVVGTAGVWLLGPWAMGLVYGPRFGVDRLDLTLVALSGGVYMVAQVLAQVLLAHAADTRVAVGWALGLAAVPLALLLPLPPTTQVAVALCLSSAVALAAHAVGVAATTRGRVPPALSPAGGPGR